MPFAKTRHQMSQSAHAMVSHFQTILQNQLALTGNKTFVLEFDNSSYGFLLNKYFHLFYVNKTFYLVKHPQGAD